MCARRGRSGSGTDDPGDIPERARARHAERIERAFAAQAAAFEDPRFNRPFATDMEWLFAALELGPDDLVLDVATGTGQAARALADRARAVIGIDATTAMLEAGRAEAEAHRRRNIVFQRGDALSLPFLDRSFDVVVCRFAAHHFEDPRRLLAGMARCLRAHGRLVLADMIAAPERALAREQDRLERLRDPSHVRMLTADELVALVAGAGLAVLHTTSRERERPLEPWLTQAGADATAVGEIRARLRDELAGGPASGFAPRQRDGELHFRQRFAAVTARAPG
ncbi:MAG: methyltransferase domain-containing protein [Solirubrobacterales bacterium]|nr:methyltransferase domain-containing protein [Solirubrobacterales bacterium]